MQTIQLSNGGGRSLDQLDKSVGARVPVYISKDDRYFPADIYQGIPALGYSKMVENILNNPLIEVRLNTDFNDVKTLIDYENLYFTGSIDELFECDEPLPYRSLYFDVQSIDKSSFQSNSVINYPNNYDFTRIIEHRYFLDEISDKTIISIEYPRDYIAGKNERYYPIPNDANQKLYEKYLAKLSVANTKLRQKYKNGGIYVFGRLGDYKYYDMDKAIRRALDVAKETL